MQESAPFFFAFLTLSILAAELNRAKSEREEPVKVMSYNSDNELKGNFGALLKDDYYHGDVWFDHLGLNPSDAKEFTDIQTKELQNGRLAMFAAIGMIVQEHITHDTIFGTLTSFF